MFARILSLGKETAIYGLSTVLGRLLNFLLVPFYTNLLVPGEFGIIANVYAYIAFVVVVYGYGMEQAYMRFFSTAQSAEQREVFSAPFFSLVVSSVVFSSLIYVFAPAISLLIDVGKDQAGIIGYAAWIVFFDTVALIPFASFRMVHRAKTFAALKLSNIVLTLVLNVVFLVSFHMKVEGVFLANLVASVTTCVLSVWMVRPNITLRFSSARYAEILRFALPLMPAGLAGVALQVVDRPILKSLTDDATLGIYQANYRLGIFMMLVVGMFDYAWRPFFLNHANDPDAKPMFAKILTYFSAVLMSVFLFVSLFVEDLVRLQIGGRYLLHPDYWPGLAIIPWVLFAYVFTGMYTVFVPGVYLEKKTQYVPLNSGFGAILKVVLNFSLIPVLGLMGAAQATLWAYVAMAGGMFLVSQRFYRIDFEWVKILKVTLLAVGLYAFSRALSLDAASLAGILAKIMIAAAYVASLFALGVIETSELQRLKTLFARKR
ncbi:MAG: oligosaccharide flippase family protein [Ignavibacteriales bacterium]|nr:oligosaccharide flippase family protein [Ignavibacteriales bacterium]